MNIASVITEQACTNVTGLFSSILRKNTIVYIYRIRNNRTHTCDVNDGLSYLQCEGVDDLAQLMRFGVKRGWTVEQKATAVRHPPCLQFLIPTVHKTPGRKSRGQSFRFQGCARFVDS